MFDIHVANRILNPMRWSGSGKILVGGESLAVLGAIVAMLGELLAWSIVPYIVIGAALVGTIALLWYSVDLITQGVSPLTPSLAHHIKTVMTCREMERQGIKIHWDEISPTGSIGVDESTLPYDPEFSAIMDKHWAKSNTGTPPNWVLLKRG